MVVGTEWDTDVSDTYLQNEAACAAFAELLPLFFFEDVEGFAGEIGAKFLRKNGRPLFPFL